MGNMKFVNGEANKSRVQPFCLSGFGSAALFTIKLDG